MKKKLLFLGLLAFMILSVFPKSYVLAESQAADVTIEETVKENEADDEKTAEISKDETETKDAENLSAESENAKDTNASEDDLSSETKTEEKVAEESETKAEEKVTEEVETKETNIDDTEKISETLPEDETKEDAGEKTENDNSETVEVTEKETIESTSPDTEKTPLDESQNQEAENSNTTEKEKEDVLTDDSKDEESTKETNLLSETKEKTEDTENKEAPKEKEKSEGDFRITIMSDTHLLPEEYIKDTDDYQKAKDSDRKLFTESEGLIKAAIALAEKNHSNIILIPGDLTKDGEKLAHEKMAKYLEEWVNAGDEDRYVFVVPGNHDISNLNAKNFNTADGKAVQVDTVNDGDFVKIYGELMKDNIISRYRDSKFYKEYLKNVNSKFGRKEGYEDYAQGYSSYIGRVPSKKAEDNNIEGYEYGINGFTIIGLDTTKHTADVVGDHKDGHQETGGDVNESLLKWISEESKKAKDRNDVVAIMSHHAFIPHFLNQEKVLSPYIIDSWKKTDWESEDLKGKTPGEILALNSSGMLFTGHMHSQDIAMKDYGNGAVLYDIETGSVVTHPTPVRHLTIENRIEDEEKINVDIKSEYIGDFTFKDADGVEKTKNAFEYSQKELITKELVKNYVGRFIDGLNVDDMDIQDIVVKYVPNSTNENYGEVILKLAGGTLLSEDKNIKNGMVKIHYDGDKNEVDADVDVMSMKIPVMIRGEKVTETLNALFDQIEEKVLISDKLKTLANGLVDSVFDAEVAEEGEGKKTLSELANYVYGEYLRGDEHQEQWLKNFLEKYSDSNNNFVKDLINNDSIKGSINDIALGTLGEIEYRLPGDNEVGYESRFFENLIENRAEQPGLYKFAMQMIPSFTGSNVYKTLTNETLVKMITGEEEAPEEEKDRIMALVNKALETGVVDGELKKVLNQFGIEVKEGSNSLDTVNDFAISIIKGMTDENAEGYEYAYVEDNNTKLELSEKNLVVRPEEPTEPEIPEVPEVPETPETPEEIETPNEQNADEDDHTLETKSVSAFLEDKDGSQYIKISLKNQKKNAVYFVYLNNNLVLKITTDGNGNAIYYLAIDEIKEGGNTITIKDEYGNTIFERAITNDKIVEFAA